MYIYIYMYIYICIKYLYPRYPPPETRAATPQQRGAGTAPRSPHHPTPASISSISSPV